MGFEDDDESGDGWVDIFDSSLTDFGAICRELFGGNYTPL